MIHSNIIFHASEQAGKKSNQDRYAYFANDDKSLCFIVVADGVGGSSDGEKAAEIIIEQSKHYWQKYNNDSESFLLDFVATCNDEIKAYNLQGNTIASTIVAMVVDEGSIISVHAGDSRAIQFNKDEMVKQTCDHSLAYAKFLLGKVSQEEIATDPSQSRLLNCLSGEDDYEAEITHWDNNDGEHFIICSDGFWEIFSTEQMLELIANENRQFIFTNHFDDQLEKLPKHDNTTVVILATSNKAENHCASTEGNASLNKVPVPSKSHHARTSFIVLLIIVFMLMLYLFTLEDTEKQEIPSNTGEQLSSFQAVKEETNVKIENSESKDEADQSDLANEGLTSSSHLKVEVAEGEAAEDKIVQKLRQQNLLSKESQLQIRSQSHDQYAKIISSQLFIHNTPVFGAIINYQVKENSVEILSGKLAKLDKVPASPIHSFKECFANYVDSEQAKNIEVKQTEPATKLYIDPASEGYFWQLMVSITYENTNKNMELHLLDASCNRLRMLPANISS